MVFQNYALWPHITVARNVAYPLKARKHNAFVEYDVCPFGEGDADSLAAAGDVLDGGRI
jgi:ABC-type sugar transport system ATPase subunit